ncbi:MAG: cyclic nucleotide-binding domain-containing protein [Thermodesulfobacteriota bacterium]
MEDAADIYHSKMMQAMTDAMAKIPLFDPMDEEDVKTIARYMFFLEFKAGDVVFHEGDRGDYVCFVVDGELEVYKVSKNGDLAPITRLTNGESIGEMSVVDDFPRSASVRALRKTKVLTLTHANFDNLVENHPKVGNKLLKGIARALSMNLRKASCKIAG